MKAVIVSQSGNTIDIDNSLRLINQFIEQGYNSTWVMGERAHLSELELNKADFAEHREAVVELFRKAGRALNVGKRTSFIYNGVMVRINGVNLAKELIKLNAEKATALVNAMNELSTEYGVELAPAQREGDSHLRLFGKTTEVFYVEPGTATTVDYVGGTYFGSGAYDRYQRLSVGAEIVETGVKNDTGFAVEVEKQVVLNEPGQWFIDRQSAYPGSNYCHLYICKAA